MYFILKKTILILVLSHSLYAQKMEFTDRGLNLFPLNSTIDSKSISSIQFSKIDTTSLGELIEYRNAVSLYDDETLNVYLKVNLDNYKLPVEGIKSIYIGLKDYEIRKITVQLDDNSVQHVTNLFNQMYTDSNIEIETELNNNINSSKMWYSGKYEIYLSGIAKTIVFTCCK